MMMIATILLAFACSDVTSGARVQDQMCGSSICFIGEVCCSDDVCCQPGTTCNTETGRCDSQDGGSVLSFGKQETIAQSVEVILCDSTHYCPDASTCCRIANNQWGCCPAPSAVCCSDMTHCCPNGYSCNSGGCVSSEGKAVNWMRKTLALLRA